MPFVAGSCRLILVKHAQGSKRMTSRTCHTYRDANIWISQDPEFSGKWTADVDGDGRDRTFEAFTSDAALAAAKASVDSL